MSIIDSKLKGSLKAYIFQSILATVSIVLVLIFLDILEHGALIATLGASAFIVFIMPHSYISMSKQVLGGYGIGIVCGVLCFLLIAGFSSLFRFIPAKAFIVIFGALAVGVAVFLMAVLNLEHPPAVGISLGLVLNQWNHQTLIFILFAVIIMLTAKKMLQPVLIDLI